MRWPFLLGGMLVWAAHFGGAYAISSTWDLVDHAGAASARLAVGLLTGAAVLANLALLAAAARREPRLAAHRDGLSRFLNGAGALGAFVSLAAVIWQGLPILIIGY